MASIAQLLAGVRVLPVLTLETPAEAVNVARALATGGLRVLEGTLRTDRALEAIAAIVAEVPEAIVGVGTVRTPAQLERATRAGRGSRSVRAIPKRCCGQWRRWACRSCGAWPRRRRPWRWPSVAIRG